MIIGLRENTDRRKIAFVFITIMMVMNLVGVIVYIYAVNFLGANLESMPAESQITFFDNTIRMYTILYLIMYLLAGWTFILWFRRAYYNMHEFTNGSAAHPEWWAGVGWFVPIIFFFRPVEIMREFWQKTIAFLKDKSSVQPMRNYQNVITIWWVPWVIALVLSNLSGMVMGEGDNLEMLRNSFIMEAIASCVSVFSALVLLKIMKAYGELEDELLITNYELEEDSIFYSNSEDGADL